MKTKVCHNCDVEFTCGSSYSGEPCWCNSFPPIFKPDSGKDCLCSQCLLDEMKRAIEDYVKDITPAQAKDVDLKRYQTKNLIAGIDYYIENGLYVFTKWYHLKRGECCKSGCRHCPYGFKKIIL